MANDVDEQAKGFKLSIMVFLSGAVTCGFLGWLCWIVTVLVFAGVPDADRAGLIGTLVVTASGVVISAVVAARASPTSPFDFLKTMFDGVRSMVRK